LWNFGVRGSVRSKVGREGALVGELGLTGFQNARYWNGVLGTHPLFEDLGAAVLLREAAAASSTGGGAPAAAEVVPAAARAFLAGLEAAGSMWDADRFVALCSEAVLGGDAALEAFCARVQYLEWCLLYRRVHATALQSS